MADRAGWNGDVIPLRSGTGGGVPLEGAIRDRLLDATDRLVQQIGAGKTSMADVARGAGVSRGTLYRYFESREVLLDALSNRGADRFFAEAAALMEPQPTLSARLGALSELMVRAIHPDVDDPEANRVAMVRMLATQGAHALVRTARLLRPFLESARRNGEVRSDLDVADASEWLARIILSFTVFQASIAYAADDPASVASFVQRYAIDGLT
ncbi:TetR/AcrR family transcriptional regulator [Cryptosporangium aurantiacum]|uniref:Transcriptional regulator, TetR family n=1 Tax=Cryptosporangium aurantiacum TaxID=134849 RepID=A0A1M7R2U0_9ACTN|nr:TetR/AcrR family transcriptional regulator [Cryptosporangium aurantiacum]SHN39322.1 transcriptional regulator, TetR family [Cryptosporangium aurantiacum]